MHCENGSKKCCCRKTALIISGILFALVAICHLYRLISGHQIMMNGTEVPNWASVAVVVVSGVMAIWNFCASCCKKCSHHEALPPK